MSRLWGMIDAIQIIVLLPLSSLSFPANVQLVFNFLQNNMNFQIIPVDLNAMGIITFNYSADVALSEQFAAQDIF